MCFEEQYPEDETEEDYYRRQAEDEEREEERAEVDKERRLRAIHSCVSHGLPTDNFMEDVQWLLGQLGWTCEPRKRCPRCGDDGVVILVTVDPDPGKEYTAPCPDCQEVPSE